MATADSTTVAPVRLPVCKQCRQSFTPRRGNPNIFCSNPCKSEWQKTLKPVDRDWLFEKYVEELRSANDIARIVSRDPKRVWEWLKGYGIPTRPRGSVNNGHQFATGHKLNVGRVTSPATREKMRQARLRDGRVPYLKNGVHWFKGKMGSASPSWKGGVTPERQQVYASAEWKAAVKIVWRRDNAACQRCGKRNSKGQRFAFDIHHIVSFAHAPLRCEPSNLVLLCEVCHYWVHSSENMDQQFIKEVTNAAQG